MFCCCRGLVHLEGRGPMFIGKGFRLLLPRSREVFTCAEASRRAGVLMYAGFASRRIDYPLLSR